MKIHIFKNYEELSKAAAQAVAKEILACPNITLGLATGSTPIGLYEELIRLHEAGLLSFAKVKSFNLDEYLNLPLQHPESYHAFMDRQLFSRVDIDPRNTKVPNGMSKDPEAECRNYDAAIEIAGGIDLQILGIGINAHIGFNEPGDRFISGTHITGLTDSTIEANSRFFERREDVPVKAITMGLGSIMKARKIFLLANGGNKAEAIRATVQGEVGPQAPSSILQFHPEVHLFIDEAAASLLEER